MDQGEEIIIGNRRLRKIKRPRQYTGPIESSTSGSAPVVTGFPQLQTSQQQSEVDFTPSYVQNDPNSFENEQFQSQMIPALDSIEKKKVLLIALGCVFFGLLIGKFLFGSPQVVQHGLPGVVVNPEVPKGRSRCGMVEKTQGCVLYVMNPQRQDLNGRDFYDWAAQQTGRQRFVIETGNMRYSNVRIRPGGIAQINIPPLQ